ncbi:MAG: hypothetical protein SF182_26525 [Deltaproteobacteria bacterium]|nr:hypothetical protein [Deltaproteobacteria bacterium]
MPRFDAESIEQRRDRTFRRLATLRVGGRARAAQFLDTAGLASLFAYRQLNLPCLWVAVCGRRDPVFPRHSHHDPEIALAWNLKDELPAAGRVFYAKLLRGKPTFVAWDLFPPLYRLFHPPGDPLAAYRAGLLSPAAKAILDALQRKRPQETFALKLQTNLARPSQRRAFDLGVEELQRKLYICMTEVRYDPAFTYVYDLIEARHAEPVRAARRCREDAAALAVLRRYLPVVVAATLNDCALVVGGRARAERALRVLAREGAVDVDAAIAGRRGRWIVAR